MTKLILDDGDSESRPKLTTAIVQAVKEFKMAENDQRKKRTEDLEADVETQGFTMRNQ